MDIRDLQPTIEQAWEDRARIDAGTTGLVRTAVDAALEALDAGRARVAEKGTEGWIVNQWLKKAVLLSFRLNDMVPVEGGPGGASWYDKVPSKFAGWGANRFKAAGFRAVPGCVVRRSAYIAPGVVLMPSFVNLGAYVDSGTMIDTWATVGSCAQIGKNCHISGGAGIGGRLLHRRAQRGRGGRRRRDRSGAVDGRLYRRLDPHRRPAQRRGFHGPRARLLGRRARRDAGQAACRRVPRAEHVLRRHRQARRREDPLQDLDQRIAARMSAAAPR
jgi:hypothetical protein